MLNSNENTFPVKLEQLSSQQLGISWSNGHESVYSARHLRLICRCANCVDEWTREKTLKDESVPVDIYPKKMETVGRYALKIRFSDGHDTGIYTFDQLLKNCECSKCKTA